MNWALHPGSSMEKRESVPCLMLILLTNLRLIFFQISYIHGSLVVVNVRLRSPIRIAIHLRHAVFGQESPCPPSSGSRVARGH